ncbi:MAG: alpha/beta hydrolase [Acidimicrobiales bacterium]|nr:alpha/beta hydrolase [Acidimicrobiales bacterium]
MSSYWCSMLGGEVRYRDVKGVRTRLLEAGDPSDERVVLCVHGSGGHAENFVTNVVTLAAAGRVLAPDLLGHGLNSRPEGADYTMRGVLDHLDALLELVGARRVTVIGLSLGGALAGHLALRRPELVDTAVMICPSGLAPGPQDPERLRAAAARMRDGTTSVLADPTWERCRARVANLLSDASRLPEEMVALRHYMYTRPGAETMAAILDDNAAHAEDYVLGDAALANLKSKTLLVWGRHNATPISVAEAACKVMAHGELSVFDDSGHWPHVEETDAFHAKVLEFLGKP